MIKGCSIYGETGMKAVQIRGRTIALVCGLLLCGATTSAVAQTVPIKTEYLMTYVAPLDAPIGVDGSLQVFNVKPGGWVKGPKINGTCVSPAGDWLRTMPSGVFRLDVRAVIRTDDGAAIYVSYNGILQHSRESLEKLARGEVLTDKDVPYFVTAPTFQTSSEKYAWLNGVQAVGKMVEVKAGAGGYVKYDVFIVR
jgi:hypothetical protein